MDGLKYNVDELDPLLRELSEALSGDMAEPMADIGELLVQSVQDRIQKGIAPDGTPFAPRSKTTLKRYAKQGRSFGAPLNVSGLFRGSFFYETGPQSVTYGSSKIQAAVLHFGAQKGQFGSYSGKGFGGSSPTVSIPWGDIPARPTVGISEDDETNIAAELSEWIERTAEGR